MSRKKAPQRIAGPEVIPEGQRGVADPAGDDLTDVVGAADLLASWLVMPFSPEAATSIARQRKKIPIRILDGIKRLDCEAIAAFIACHNCLWTRPDGDWFQCMIARVRDSIDDEDACSMRGAEHRIRAGRDNLAAVMTALADDKMKRPAYSGSRVHMLVTKTGLGEEAIRRYLREIQK